MRMTSVDIDFIIHNILGDSHDESRWFTNLRKDLNGSTITKQDTEDSAEDGGSFGVSKLCDWMVRIAKEKKRNNEDLYNVFVKPLFMKMNMDAFHYISLLEHKLQLRQSSRLSRFQSRGTRTPLTCIQSKKYMFTHFNNSRSELWLFVFFLFTRGSMSH